MVKEFGLPWIAHLLLQIFVGAIWGMVIRIVRGRLLWGILYLITAGGFGILWIVDIVTLILNKDYTVLA